MVVEGTSNSCYLGQPVFYHEMPRKVLLGSRFHIVKDSEKKKRIIEGKLPGRTYVSELEFPVRQGQSSEFITVSFTVEQPIISKTIKCALDVLF